MNSPRLAVLSQTELRANPYGINHLQTMGYRIGGASPLRTRVLVKARDIIEHRSGRLLDIPLRTLPHCAVADLTLGLLEPVSRTACDLKRLGLPPLDNKPLVLLSCWLTQWLQQADSETRQHLTRTYSAADLILVLSTNQLEILQDQGFREDQVAAIPFGYEPYRVSAGDVHRDWDVLAAGFDLGRDYRTLLQAVDGLDAQVHMICKEVNLEGIKIPSNVILHGRVPHSEYVSALKRSKIVAVPTHHLAYPTGQTVAMEAAATGACLLYTDTPAMGEYFDSNVATPVPVGDAQGWRSALDALLADDAKRRRLGAAAQEHVRMNFTHEHMWAAFNAAVRDHGLI